MYEFKQQYRATEDKDSNNFFATYHLKGSGGEEGGDAVGEKGVSGKEAEGGSPGADVTGMRTTAAYTGAPRHRDASGEAASQSLWRSYYAQQRERDVAFNAGSYRRDVMRDTGFVAEQEYRVPHHMRQVSVSHPYEGRSPVRSASPVRVVTAQEEAALAHAAQAAAFQYTHSFSLYEQHKEQREQREHAEYQRIQTEHQRSYEIN